MKGKYHIIIQNNRVHYEFDLRRNITIIRGDSGSIFRITSVSFK
jgi:hypothetical protein